MTDLIQVRCGGCGYGPITVDPEERNRCPGCGGVVFEPEPDEPLPGYY